MNAMTNAEPKKSTSPSQLDTKKIQSLKRFLWQAENNSGVLMKSEMIAYNEAEVRISLRQRGMKLKKIEEKSLRSSYTIKAREIVNFTRQLATLLKSGVPLLRSFELLQLSTEKQGMKIVITQKSEGVVRQI